MADIETESKGSQSTRLVASTSSLLPVYAVPAFALWQYAWVVPLVVAVSLIGWSRRSMAIFAGGYAIALALGVAAAGLPPAARVFVVLMIYLPWVGVVWNRYRTDLRDAV